MSWTNDTVMEFLELYRREQNLWDPKHQFHRSRTEIMKSWQKIQESLSIHCTVDDLKRKKESLMTSFRMHLGRKKARPGYRPVWYAYSFMESFLCGIYECDSTNPLEHEYFTNTGNYTKSASPKPKMTVKKINTGIGYAKKRIDETDTYLNNASGVKSEMDEYELYGQLLAKKLRKLDETQCDLAMHEIDNVMFRAKMQSNNSQSQSQSRSPPSPVRKTKSPIFIVAQQNAISIPYEDEQIIPYQESSS